MAARIGVSWSPASHPWELEFTSLPRRELLSLAWSTEELPFCVGVGCKVQRKPGGQQRIGREGDGQEPNPSFGTRRGRSEGLWQDHCEPCFLEWFHARSFRKFTLQKGSLCFFFLSSLPPPAQSAAREQSTDMPGIPARPLPSCASPGMLLHLF